MKRNSLSKHLDFHGWSVDPRKTVIRWRWRAARLQEEEGRRYPGWEKRVMPCSSPSVSCLKDSHSHDFLSDPWAHSPSRSLSCCAWLEADVDCQISPSGTGTSSHPSQGGVFLPGAWKNSTSWSSHKCRVWSLLSLANPSTELFSSLDSPPPLPLVFVLILINLCQLPIPGFVLDHLWVATTCFHMASALFLPLAVPEEWCIFLGDFSLPPPCLILPFPTPDFWPSIRCLWYLQSLPFVAAHCKLCVLQEHVVHFTEKEIRVSRGSPSCGGQEFLHQCLLPHIPS